MALISGKYKQAANIASMDVVVEHCAFLEPVASHWCLDVRCRSGKQEWDRLRDACPEAKVVVKSNDILVSLPPLPEELELTVFGKPGECDMKRMQLCTFGRKPVIGKDWVISVYLCDDTVMAFENVYKREEKKGSKLLTTRTGLFVANSDEDIKISVNNLETGWQIKGSGTKTIKSRNAWNSPENATDFPCLKFEVCHVDEMKQSFFCGITASHGTDIAEAEIRAFFKQENEKAYSLNISNDHFKGCEELHANDVRTGYPEKNNRSSLARTYFIRIETFLKDIPLVLFIRRDLEIQKSPHVKPATFATKTRKKKTISWFNVVMLVLICFMEFSKDFKPGTQDEEMKDVCRSEEIKLMCPPLELAIKGGNCREILWTVLGPGIKSERQSLVHCDKHLKCHRYTSGIFGLRIKYDSAIYIRYIKRKQNKTPLVDQMNVYSSVNCLSIVAGQDVNLNQALGEIPSRETIGDMWVYWIKPDRKKQKIVYCDATTCLFEDCSSSCPQCRPRLKIDAGKLMLINVGEVDRGLKLECRVYPKIIGRTATQTMPQFYALNNNVVFQSDVGHVSATFTSPRNGTLHGCLKKYRCTYVAGTEERNINGSPEGGLKFCVDAMCCQWKGNTAFF